MTVIVAAPCSPLLTLTHPPHTHTTSPAPSPCAVVLLAADRCFPSSPASRCSRRSLGPAHQPRTPAQTPASTSLASSWCRRRRLSTSPRQTQVRVRPTTRPASHRCACHAAAGRPADPNSSRARSAVHQTPCSVCLSARAPRLGAPCIHPFALPVCMPRTWLLQARFTPCLLPWPPATALVGPPVAATRP